MKNLHYSQKEFEEMMKNIVTARISDLYGTTKDTKQDLTTLIHIEDKTKQLSAIMHDCVIIASYLNASFDVAWNAILKYDQLPDIKLNIVAVTPTNHYPFVLSDKTITAVKQYLLEHHIIPNVWEI